MNWKELTAVGVSIAIAATLIIAFSSPDQPLSCADGWSSSSIGQQGACSHHGGVAGGEDDTSMLAVAFSIAVGFGALVTMAKIFGLFQIPETGPFTDATSKAILGAIENRRKIEFQYFKPGATTADRRLVEPTELKMLVPGVLRSRCVVGYCDRAKDVRTFALHRMKNVVAYGG